MKIEISRILSARTVTWFILIVAMAFGLRIARIMEDDGIGKDSVIYLWMAETAAKGDVKGAVEFNKRMPPLYVALMAAGEYSGIGARRTGLAVSVMSGILLLFPVFWIARKLADDRIGLLAAVLVATHPYLVRVSAEVMRDSLFLLLLFSGLAFAVKAVEDGRSMEWIVVGVFAGLAVMTRTEGVELVVAALIWISAVFLASLRSGTMKPALKKGILSSLLVILSYLSVTLPVQIMLSGTQSSWGPIDYRIGGFFRGFIIQSNEDVNRKLEKR